MSKVIYMLFMIVLFVLSCSKGTKVVGTGSESPNALTGTVRILSGFENDITGSDTNNAPLSPCANIQLFAINEDRDSTGKTKYSWSISDSIQTDSNGNFRFDSIAMGYYSMIISKDNYKAFSGYFRIQKESREINLGNLYLSHVQTIRGRIHDTTTTVENRVKLGLVGTPYADTSAPGGVFQFDSIPQGSYNFNIEVIALKNTFNSILPISLADVRSSIAIFRSDTTSDAITYNNYSGSMAFSVPWEMQETTKSSYQDTTKLNVDNYQIEYTSTINQ